MVIPDVFKLNLYDSLPMTHLCDHLLSVYHYMHGEWLHPLSMNYLFIMFSMSINIYMVSDFYQVL